MKSIFKCASTAVIIFAVSGCASILNEDTQAVNIVSTNGKPIQGKVDGRPFKGPGIVQLQRKKADKIITVETAGCTEETVATKKVSSTFWVNILSGGAFGSTTDYSTEKMWEYDDTIVINCNG
jgi:hypothetical protein